MTERLFVLQTVQQRGAAVIQARKLSSAMSAAKATCDHLRDWWNGTKEVGIFQLLLQQLFGTEMVQVTPLRRTLASSP